MNKTISFIFIYCLIQSSICFPSRERINAYYAPTTSTTTTTTPPPPPKPYRYAFAAGRAPGGKPDRYVQQEGDEQGVIKGSYTYLDPNWKWQKVGYVADESGFRITDGSSDPLPKDTAAVAAAKARHEALFKQIANRHQSSVSTGNEETEAVKLKRAEHAEAFKRIAEEHARIAAEHSGLSSLAFQFGEIYDRRR